MIKYGLLGLVTVLGLIVGTVAYLIATFNPNLYKEQLIQTVKDKQQRTLKLDGEISLTFFPSIGAKVEKISLSEYKSSQEFAGVESVRISLALLPLLSRQLVVSDVVLSGVKVNVVKYKDGSSNFDDLTGQQENKVDIQTGEESKQAATLNFDIASVTLENTELTYRDESKGTQYALKNINLTTGRIANGIPSKINFEAVVKSDQPKLDLAVTIQATLTFGLDEKFYQIQNLDMQVKGGALDVSELLIKATGDASANFAKQEYRALKLEITANGVKGKDRFEASLDMPVFDFSSDQVAAAKLLLKATLQGESGNIDAALSMQNMQGNAQSFKSSNLDLNIEIRQAEQTFNFKLSTPLVGSVKTRQLNLSKLSFAVNAKGDKLPNKSVNSEMRGSMQVDADRESVQLSLAGGMLQSQLKAKLALKGFSNPAIRFDVDVDKFDADLYFPEKTLKAGTSSEPEPEQPFDLSALQNLNVSGNFRIGTLKVSNIKVNKLLIGLKVKQGIMMVYPLSANLYQGSVDGSITVDVSHAKPSFAVKQSVNGVQLGMLIKDVADFDMINGKANINLNLTTQGNTVTALKKGLNGTVVLNMADGAVKGFDLGKLVHGAQNLGQGVQRLKPGAGDQTKFNELKASFKINDGVAHNDDMLVKSPSLRVTGKGDIDIGNSNINYATRATLAESVDGKSDSVTVPVQLSGSFADMKIKVDYGAVVTDVLKHKVDEKIEEQKDELRQQLQKKLKSGLRDLFK